MQDLMDAEVQDILLNTITKKPYLLLRKQQVLVNKITLFDIVNQKEIQYEINAPNQIVVDRSMNLIQPEFYFNLGSTKSEFRKIDRSFAEEYLLTQQQLDAVLGLIQQLESLPGDIFVERKNPEKGTLTSQGKV
ncbi:MAG: hypothetical protein IMZ59_02130 [Actinobacteria bacterium]|nr:hypothetical protein [Actinomycetota bacterium]